MNWLALAVGMTVAASTAVAPATTPPEFKAAKLTADGTRSVVLSSRRGALVMTAPKSDPPGISNYREVIWERGGVSTTAEQSCATWRNQSDSNAQEGVAVRIRHHPATGQTTAITVTKNIYGRPGDKPHYVFNVHLWDSTGLTKYRLIGQFDMRPALDSSGGRLRRFPWRACLRAEGSRVSFMVWLPSKTSQPSWTNRANVRSVWIPARERSVYDLRGAAGWYIGHLAAGARVLYAKLDTRRLLRKAA